ncbi:hypothetical protein CXX78_00245 [Candidatus Parvarchaeota archaeon]|nr:MAG: hypothetical protein CXX78_02025 [Candidatus Parvarchaeota archaeon]PXY71583.1 MAG: hypothetical protein CXX78_00245 [Candidatus Parvarchaeota archaeon]
MDDTQKIIVALLVLAIMFSVLSLSFSFNALDKNMPGSSVSGDVVESGGSTQVSLFVKKTLEKEISG